MGQLISLGYDTGGRLSTMTLPTGVVSYMVRSPIYGTLRKGFDAVGTPSLPARSGSGLGAYGHQR